MAYADHAPLTQRSAGLAGALAIPGALAGLLVTGLAVTQPALQPRDPPLVGVDIPLPPPPPPPEPTDSPSQPRQNDSAVIAPPRPFKLPLPDFVVDADPVLPPTNGANGRIVLPPIGTGAAEIPAALAIDPAPRGDPGSWVTSDDYRSTWILRGLEGTARFTLDVLPNGRVGACRITRSSGHNVLDEATCRLISRRARFEPARDPAGNATHGSYSSSIRWVLPQ